VPWVARPRESDVGQSFIASECVFYVCTTRAVVEQSLACIQRPTNKRLPLQCPADAPSPCDRMIYGRRTTLPVRLIATLTAHARALFTPLGSQLQLRAAHWQQRSDVQTDPRSVQKCTHIHMSKRESTVAESSNCLGDSIRRSRKPLHAAATTVKIQRLRHGSCKWHTPLSSPRSG
jgi:hypothetical protein